MSDRWPVRADDGHELELLVEKPLELWAALLFVCAMGVEASYVTLPVPSTSCSTRFQEPVASEKVT